MGVRPRLSTTFALVALAATVTLSACGGGGGGGGATTYSVSGTVSGATAVGLTLVDASSGATVGSATSGVGGAYTFSGLPAGSYRLTPALSGYSLAPAVRNITVSAANVTGQDFTATAVSLSFTISGTVSVAGVGGLAGVTVTLSGSSISPKTTTTGSGGGYSFAGLAAGSYAVAPALAGYTIDSKVVVVSAADKTQDFTATAVVTGIRAISGTLTGSVVSGVTVTLSGAANATTATDGSGHFAFTGLSAGSYTVSPSAAGVLFAPQARPATVAAGDVALDPFAGQSLVAYPGLTGATLDGHLWDAGATQITLDAGTALLSDAASNVVANTGYPASLRVEPGALTGQVTALQATLEIDSISATGDTTARAGLDLVFQPVADRIAGSENQTNALYVRLSVFQTGSAGILVRPQVFECTSADCSTSKSVGTATPASTWFTSGVAAATGTSYTASIAIDLNAKTATFGLTGGSSPQSVTVSISGLTDVDVTAAYAFRTRLFAQVRGGAAGGGNGAVAARFGAVKLGQGGGALAAFDDFSSGTRLDPARWSVGEESATPVAGSPASLRMVLDQAGRGYSNSLAVTSSPRAMQAGVTVTSWSQTGPGQLGARVSAALYNDGSSGLDSGADVRRAGSQVGDIVAQLSMTATDVSYTVVRCNAAVCSQATGAGHDFLRERTSLGTVALGEPHVLRLAWDQASHTVSFQLDGRPPVVFDPVAAGAPVNGLPSVPYWHVATHTSATGTGVEYGSGSAGRIAATFQDVRTLP